MSITFRNPDGTEVDWDPETKKRFTNTLFERDYCGVHVAKMDGKFADEQEFQEALNEVYAMYGKTPPKHRKDTS